MLTHSFTGYGCASNYPHKYQITVRPVFRMNLSINFKFGSDFLYIFGCCCSLLTESPAVDGVCGGEYVELRARCHRVLRLFNECNITPIIVIDGPLDSLRLKYVSFWFNKLVYTFCHLILKF